MMSDPHADAETAAIVDTDTDAIVIARASQGRRGLGLGALFVLGALLIWLGLSQPIDLMWRVIVIAVGAGALWMADQLRRGTGHSVVLTETELRDSDGTLIAEIADIDAIDRGAFAFKPANGFLIRTRTPAARFWRPGLWWRFGKRIGIGGMTAPHQTKPMAEIIAVKLAQRDGQ